LKSSQLKLNIAQFSRKCQVREGWGDKGGPEESMMWCVSYIHLELTAQNYNAEEGLY
jgi:hypothetical protein